MGEKLKEMWGLNSPVLAFLKKLGWVFLVNILFIATSLPVITIGASSVAMYTVFHKMIEERDFRFFKDYFQAFAQNFWCATVMWMIMLVLAIILGINTVYVFTGMSGGFAFVMQAATVLVAVVFTAFANTIFPLIAKFDVTVREVLLTAAGMLMEHAGLALESAAFTAAVFGGAAAIIYTGYFSGLFILVPFIACGLHAFMQSYLYRQLFSYYLEEEETDPDYVSEDGETADAGYFRE